MRLNLLPFFILLLVSHSLQAQVLRWGGTIEPNDTALGYIKFIERIEFNAQGDLYIAGEYTDVYDLDPTSSVNLDTATNHDIFLAKVDSADNFQWSISVGASDTIIDMKLDLQGNIIVAGSFQGIDVDFDPGPDTVLLTSGSQGYVSNIFVAKYDSAGSLLWAKSFNCIDHTFYSTNLRMLSFDNSGSVYCRAFFSDSVDVDPGPGEEWRLSGGYLIKLNANGNYVRDASLNNSGGSIGPRVAIAPTGDMSLISSHVGTFDYDFGPGTYNVSNTYRTFARYDSAFNLIFVKTSMQLPNGSTKVRSDANGNTFLLSRFTGSVEHGFDTNSVVTNSIGPSPLYLVKYDTAGIVDWVRQMPVDGPMFFNYPMLSDSGYVYVSGSVYQGITMNYPNTPAFTLSGSSMTPFWAKFDNEGELVYGKSYPVTTAPYGTYGEAFSIFREDRLAIGGRLYGSLDLDFHPDDEYLVEASSSINYSSYVAVYEEDFCTPYSILIDSVAGVTCTDSGYVSAVTFFGNGNDSLWWSLDSLHNSTSISIPFKGFHTVYTKDSMDCYTSSTAFVTGPDTTPADLSVTSFTSLSLTLSDTLKARAFVYNSTCDTLTATLWTTFDSVLVPIITNPTPSSTSPNTYKWTFPGLDYDDGVQKIMVEYIDVDTLLAAMDTLDTINIYHELTPLNDYDSTNNRSHDIVRAHLAYDPNFKQVFPFGACDVGYVKSDRELTYTVQFQNTGTAPALNVVVMDTLDSNLDIETFDIVTSKHKMITELIDGHILKFRFDNINLVDSSVSQEGSIGYIIFKISAKDDVASYTEVQNKVSIYFDFNEPVVTNSTLTTFVDEIPTYNNSVTLEGTDSLSFEGKTYYENTSFTSTYYATDGCDSVVSYTVDITIGLDEYGNEQWLRAYPNPSNNQLNIDLSKATENVVVEIVDVQNRPVYRINLLAGKMHRLEHDWPAGVYFIKAQAGDQITTQKLVVQ